MTNIQKAAICSVVLIAAIAICAILYITDPFGTKGGKGVQFIHNKDAKTLSYTGDKYEISVDYNKKFCINKLSGEGKSILAPGRGIYINLQTEAGNYTSLNLDKSPDITINGDINTNIEATFSFEGEYTFDKVTLTFKPEEVVSTFERVFKEDTKITQQGFPSINIHQDSIENIRWHKSGSNFWIAGKASKMRNFLAAGSGYLPEKGEQGFELGNIKRAMEDITFTLLSPYEDKFAVSFIGNTEMFCATEVQRYEDNLKHLEMNVVLADKENIEYTGNEDGWGSYNGKTVSQGKNIYKPFIMKKDRKDTVTFYIRPDDFDKFYDLGTLKGVDESLISQALNNYGRLMMLDYNMGSSLESPNHFLEVPALEQHWNTNLISLFFDDGALEAQKNGMRVIRDKLQAPDGHIKSPYPWVHYDDWGSSYSDMMPGYVLSVVYLYSISGDRPFLDEMIDSCIKALDCQQKRYIKGDVFLCGNLKNKEVLNANDYWEHTKGEYNGYTSAMYYESLVLFSDILKNIYDNNDKADKYISIAEKIKSDFNRLMWSDKTNTFLYGSDNLDIQYLPVQGAAIRSGITQKERVIKIVESVETKHREYNLKFHVMNVMDILDSTKPADQSDDYKKSMLGMNGGWYGQADGDFYSGFPVYGDRSLIPMYINNFTSFFEKTGFVGATAYKWDGITPADYGWYDSMPTLVYPVWGLYTYAYGFQPKYDRLNIAPFIDKSMEGSTVKYRWRQCDMTVTYDSVYSFEIDISSLPADIYFQFINQTPDKDYVIQVNGNDKVIKADGNGTVNIKVESVGKTQLKITNPDK